jgi:predicted secreted protein
MSELPATVTLRVGEDVTLHLPSLAGAGYRWEATVDDESVTDAQTQFDDAVTSRTGRASFSENELLTVHGRRVGTTRVHCVQRRGWERGTAPVAEYSLTVNVVPAAGVEPVEKEGTNGT